MIHFQPNCTIPPETPGFVTAPNVRSTMNIVWSCISTILLCCWSVQHLNVPPQFQPKTTRQKLMRKLFFFWRKLKWMMIALVSPEFILAKAIADLHPCRLHSPILEKLANADGVPWSKTHTFLADMGGFALRFTPSGYSDPIQLQSLLSDDFRPRNSQSQERPASTETYDSAQITRMDQSPPEGLARSAHDTTCQRELMEEPSPGIRLTRSLSITEQYNRQALISERVIQQQSGLAQDRLRPGDLLSESESERWINYRRRFEARLENASQHFGDMMWRAFTHNQIISGMVRWTISKKYRIAEDPEDVLPTLLKFEGDVWVLTTAQLIEARRRKLIVQLPHLTEDEISDRNKEDLFVKLLSLLQVSWMVIQIIARATLHIPSTPLGIMTLSFAACAFFTFILLLDHPQDVTTCACIDAARLSTVDDMRRMANLSPLYCWFTTNRLPCVPNNAIPSIDRGNGTEFTHVYFNAGIVAGAAAFGGVHLVAWNFDFPTVVERTLWRTSSLVTLLAPLATILVDLQSAFPIWRFRGRSMPNSRDLYLQPLTGLAMLALVLARLFVVVEAFRSLYYLPPDAYIATWAANAPYIA